MVIYSSRNFYEISSEERKMSSVINKIYNQKIVQMPTYVSSTEYEVIMGSEAYGVSSGSSDIDIYGFCIPSKESIFPHLSGEIQGFDEPKNKFEQWQQHHVKMNEKEYDFQIFNIVKYFKLLSQNNPNICDSLFVPQRCVIHSTKIGEHIRLNRDVFLHKGAYHKFTGYLFSQLHKAKEKTYVSLSEILWEDYGIDTIDLEKDIKDSGNLTIEIIKEALEKNEFIVTEDTLKRFNDLLSKQKNGISAKRFSSVLKNGADTKFLYHIVRLADEIEQILSTGTLDLERSKEMMKAVRRGEMSLEEVETWAYEKQKLLEKLYHESNVIPHSPDMKKIKGILLDCLEMKFGTIDNFVSDQSSDKDALFKIRDILKTRNI